MATTIQFKFKINGLDVYQPDKGLQYSIETTYNEDATRSTTGKLNLKRQFTIASIQYSAKNMPIAEATKILELVGLGKTFNLYYYDPFLGGWTSRKFYVGSANCTLQNLKTLEETCDLDFTMTSVNPY